MMLFASRRNDESSVEGAQGAAEGGYGGVKEGGVHGGLRVGSSSSRI